MPSGGRTLTSTAWQILASPVLQYESWRNEVGVVPVMATYILTPEHTPCRPGSPFCEGCGYLRELDPKGHNWQCERFGFSFHC